MIINYKKIYLHPANSATFNFWLEKKDFLLLAVCLEGEACLLY